MAEQPKLKAAGDPRGKQADWTLLPPAGPDGACMQCAQVHDPDMPHNPSSLAYQYSFYAEHDRWPTWRDAMAHCTAEVREQWMQELRKHGVEVY